MKNRILFVTSALQVIIAKASIDHLNYKDEQDYRTYVLMIHPSLNQNSKNGIEYYSNKFNFYKIIDLTYFFKEKKKKEFNYRLNFFKFFILKVKNIKMNMYFNNTERPNIILEISKFIKTNIGDTDEIFIRTNYKVLDLAFYESISNIKKINVIEDGYYDYLNNYYFSKIFKYQRVKQFVINRSYAYLIFLLSFFKTFKLKQSIKNNLRYQIKYSNKFNSFNSKNSINIGSRIKKNFKKYSEIEDNNKNIIIIIGTVFWDWEISNDDEALIYNDLIEKIKKKYLTKNSNIFYKPHPRCRNLEFKKINLNCEFFEKMHNVLIEEYFSKYNVNAVYSFGSTSSLYSKILFNIPSYFIDITKFKRGNTNFNYKILRDDEFMIFKKYGVKKVTIT